ncbi:MAG TPA: hypothetical protein DCG71_05165 [Brevundimonas sp.]|nr:hypothetical protein [Brevundimonas sp.]
MSGLVEQAWSDIHLALRERGFSFEATRRGITTYRGAVKSGRLEVAVRLAIEDPLMTMGSPKIWIIDPDMLKRIRAHLNTDGTLCYADAGLEEYDPYDAGRAILRALQSVRETLAIVLHGSAAADVEREFLAYWKAERLIFTDLPSDFTGEAKTCPCDCGMIRSIVTTPERVARWNPRAGIADLKPVRTIRIERPLNPLAGDGPGKSLGSFRRWLSHFLAEGDVRRILAAKLIDRSGLILLAPNGGISPAFDLPPAIKKAFKHSTVERRAQWIARHEEEVVMSRGEISAIALEEVVNARLATPSPLIGKSIAVVGCGAVGSRLILDLVRCGGAQGERPLLLVDPDTFSPANLARHTLPLAALGRCKAVAMAEEAVRLHPDASVEAAPTSALKLLERLAGYDLIVDATGYNPLALRLNDEAVGRRRKGRRFPPIVHAAVHGNGAAVQTILVTDSAHACLKCLRPEHGMLKADPLRPGAQTMIRPAACGDGGHIPYAAPAPAMAAALALQAALEWAANTEVPGHRVRTRVLDLERTNAPRDRNWAKDLNCPACRSQAADAT